MKFTGVTYTINSSEYQNFNSVNKISDYYNSSTTSAQQTQIKPAELTHEKNEAVFGITNTTSRDNSTKLREIEKENTYNSDIERKRDDLRNGMKEDGEGDNADLDEEIEEKADHSIERKSGKVVKKEPKRKLDNSDGIDLGNISGSFLFIYFFIYLFSYLFFIYYILFILFIDT